MATTIEIVARERKLTEAELITQLLDQHMSQRGVAKALGIAPTVITYWLKQHGYKVKRVVKTTLVPEVIP